MLLLGNGMTDDTFVVFGSDCEHDEDAVPVPLPLKLTWARGEGYVKLCCVFSS